MACPFSTKRREEVFFFFSTIPSSRHGRRLDFRTCSLDPSSSSCCSSSSCTCSSQRVSLRQHRTLNKSLEFERRRIGIGFVSATQNRSFGKENQSSMVWKSPVGRGKKPLWKKVLFASKKQVTV